MNHILHTCDLQEIKLQLRSLRRKITSLFIAVWKNKRNVILADPDSKLHLLAKITPQFKKPRYTDFLENHNIRNAMCRFRTSAHNLPIETQRFLNIPRHLRICPFCCQGIGDESHYLLKCQYNNLEESIEINKSLIAQYADLPLQDQVVVLLTDPNDENILTLGRHIKLVEGMFRDSFE